MIIKLIVARSKEGDFLVRDREQSVLLDGGWLALEGPGFRVHAFAAGGSDDYLVLAARTPGQIEVFTQTPEGDLVWTWWS